MLKTILTAIVLPLVLLFGPPANGSGNSRKTVDVQDATGTLVKMVVENGSVTMDLDVNRLNGKGSVGVKLETLRFAVGANSFFSVLVFNDLLRHLEQGSMALVPQQSAQVGSVVGVSLNQLVLKNFRAGERVGLAVLNGTTGLPLFNIEGYEYKYDAGAQLLTINGDRLLMSKEFANVLGRPSDAGAVVGKISIGAAMQPIQIDQIVNGDTKSMALPPLRRAVGTDTPSLVAGPDVIVGDIEEVRQFGSAGTQVGLAVGTDSCNNGDEPVNWFALPQTDHPVVPQNLYRMSGGPNNNDRFEQVGHSWMKHTFLALEDFVCGNCDTSNCATGSHLCPGCSDPYVADLNASQGSLGSRAWLNPFTGSFPSGANNHNGHSHDGVSHRIRVDVSDLNTTLNPGATYFGEAAYISPHEYAWCQSHPGECNMYNNASYRQFTVTGTNNFTFTAVGSTFRMKAAITGWTNATINHIEPDPGNDGFGLVGFKVTNPSPGVWHYDYAVYNQNLDRGIQSFSVPVGPGTNLTNIGFHAPPQEPAFPNDGTFNSQGYSSSPWNVTQIGGSITWSCETFAQNQNANAIRFGTLYNFRFDADQPPQNTNATVGFFKTGSPITVAIEAPGGATPTPTPTATPTATTSPTPTPSATPTATPTATATATATPRPSPTPRTNPTARPRPTAVPRPAPG